MNAVELLLIGGGAGVGKSTLAWEISAQLQRDATSHCWIEGDFLDQVHPAPVDDPQRSGITERNLASIWRNYATLGQHRLIYANTVSVLEEPMIRRAMGGGPIRVTSILLTAGERSIHERLTQREIGSGLIQHLERSRRMSRELEDNAPVHTVRIATDDRSIQNIAEQVVTIADW